jgi:hypothetical protein
MAAATILEYAFQKSFYELKKTKKTEITKFSRKKVKIASQPKKPQSFNLNWCAYEQTNSETL